MRLELSSLTKAISQLKEAIDFSQSTMAVQNERLFQQFRNSVIRCFEFTYELSYSGTLLLPKPLMK